MFTATICTSLLDELRIIKAETLPLLVDAIDAVADLPVGKWTHDGCRVARINVYAGDYSTDLGGDAAPISGRGHAPVVDGALRVDTAMWGVRSGGALAVAEALEDMGRALMAKAKAF